MTENQKIGWKVVNNNRKSIVVCYGPRFPGRLYPKGVKVTPKNDCGPLCVFETSAHARDWATSSLVLKCVYVPSLHHCIWDSMDSQKIPLHQLLSGTVLADSVTCLE